MSFILVTIYLARMLLTFGNHTLFSLIILILLSITLLKIPAQKAVKIALLLTILLFLFEAINYLVFNLFLTKESFDQFMDSDFGLATIGFSSNTMLGITLFAIYIYRNKKEKKLTLGE